MHPNQITFINHESKDKVILICKLEKIENKSGFEHDTFWMHATASVTIRHGEGGSMQQ